MYTSSGVMPIRLTLENNDQRNVLDTLLIKKLSLLSGVMIFS